ncbi:MAG TPA: LamG-like jellyroll fold domain-containing protein [Candidatus Paceibacterota bacterium]|nr:LamG-like jellyroll fold domain-containing protein [Candidatus Paceibacterota bacterium]
MKKGFTLVELLVVIAIIAILAVVVILTINPTELLRQGRDATRVSDMSTLNKAISLYYQDAMSKPSTMFMGTSSVVYVSVPDPTATSTAGDQCQGLSLPSLPTGFIYQCAASSTYMNTNGTGWIPINFNSYSAGAVISKLPVDPMNTTSTNLYYTYETDGIGGFKLAAFFESQKYAPQMASDGGTDPELYEKGSNLSLPTARGLVGYWPFNEGTGTIANDISGNGNNGTWNGSLTAGSYYTTGKVGPWAGTFDGTDDYLALTNNDLTSSLSGEQITVLAWVNPVQTSKNDLLSFNGNYNFFAPGNRLGSNYISYWDSTNGWQHGNNIYPMGSWSYIGFTINGTALTFYGNGNPDGTGTVAPFTVSTSTPIRIGLSNAGEYAAGLFDDIRVYDRVLSATEIQEMYNAEK